MNDRGEGPGGTRRSAPGDGETPEPAGQPAVPEGARRAAAYFRERGLARLVAEASRSYYRNGRPAGVARLDDATAAEHDGLAGLTGRKAAAGALRVRLADLDERLRASGFACSLEELLVAWSGEALATRPTERAAAEAERAQRRAGWQRDLEAIAAARPAGSLARRWLESGAHGLPWLLRRAERAALSGPGPETDERRDVVWKVALALDRLPLAEPRRLAVLASEVAGDPHALDPGAEAGRLFALALLDVFGGELGLAGGPGERLDAASRRQLCERVGVFPESVSSTVAVAGLVAAARRDGTPDPLIAGAGQGLLVLPLRRLLEWRSVQPGHPDVYLLENPTVFEDVVDALEAGVAGNDRAAPGSAAGARRRPPTIACTAGWPNLAVWRLLDLLTVGEPGCVFHYSGDFDLGGLRIAGSVRARHPERFRPWRLDPASYRLALHEASPACSPDERRQLALLGPAFPDLVAAMLEAGRWAYQEAIGRQLAHEASGAITG